MLEAFPRHLSLFSLSGGLLKTFFFGRGGEQIKLNCFLGPKSEKQKCLKKFDQISLTVTFTKFGIWLSMMNIHVVKVKSNKQIPGLLSPAPMVEYDVTCTSPSITNLSKYNREVSQLELVLSTRPFFYTKRCVHNTWQNLQTSVFRSLFIFVDHLIMVQTLKPGAYATFHKE